MNNWEDYDYLRNRIDDLAVELLRSKTGNMLLERDIRKHFLGAEWSNQVRHRWEKLRNFMTRSGKVKVVHAKIASYNSSMNVVLLADPDQSDSASMEGQSSSEPSSPMPEMTEKCGIRAEIPLLYQIYRTIQSSKKGVTLPMLCDRFFIDNKKCKVLLDNLRDNYGVIAKAEKIGKQTTYRYTLPDGARLDDHEEDNDDMIDTDESEIAVEGIVGDAPTNTVDVPSSEEIDNDEMDINIDDDDEVEAEGTDGDSKSSSLSRVVIVDAPIQSPGRREVSKFSKRGSKHKNPMKTTQLNERIDKVVAIFRERQIITSEDLSHILSDEKSMYRGRSTTFCAISRIRTWQRFSQYQFQRHKAHTDNTVFS